MAKKQIQVVDFDLFCEVVKSAGKLVESAKISIGPSGLEIFGARPGTARCELKSNAVASQDPLSFSVQSIASFMKVAATVKEIHEGDYSGMKFYYDEPFIRFESKKFKTKYASCNEDIISGWVSKAVTTEMKTVFEFTSTPDLIKRVGAHSFMFSDPKSARVYVETKPDMENNAVFATIGNKETALNNELTLKLGLVTSGSLLEKDENGLVVNERKIILDIEKLQLFNAVQADEIKFELTNYNVLVGRSGLSGKNGTYFDLVLYCNNMKS